MNIHNIATLRIHVPPRWAPTFAPISSGLINCAGAHDPAINSPFSINSPLSINSPFPPTSLSHLPISPSLCARSLQILIWKVATPSDTAHDSSHQSVDTLGSLLVLHLENRHSVSCSAWHAWRENAPPASTPPLEKPDTTTIDWGESSQIWTPNFSTRTAPS